MIKALATLIALTATALPTLARSSHEAHVLLARAVEKTGVKVYVNGKICDERQTYGMYIPSHQAVVICQENRVKGSDDTVQWTEEDYDTLRHEVHHVVQDCRDGLNGALHAVYTKPIEFGVHVMGRDKAIGIAKMYEDNGASEHMQVMEIEAFAVAQLNDPAEQIQDIQRYCM